MCPSVGIKCVIVCVSVRLRMSVVMTCVFPNVSKILPDIWVKYCADVAAWKDGLTGGNRSAVFSLWHEKERGLRNCVGVKCDSSYSKSSLSSGFSLWSSTFWHTTPNRNTSSALNTPISRFWEPVQFAGASGFVVKMLYLHESDEARGQNPELASTPASPIRPSLFPPAPFIWLFCLPLCFLSFFFSSSSISSISAAI